VEWFNRVDATYRTDLRELNDLNFARFDARLDQRVAASEAKIEQRITALEAKLEQRITALEAKLDQRITALDARVDQRVTAIEFEQRMAQLESRMNTGFAELRAELLRWMFIYWGGSVVTTVGLVLLVLSAVRA
jgi:uncharacterized coiled-coil protein SlyX